MCTTNLEKNINNSIPASDYNLGYQLYQQQIYLDHEDTGHAKRVGKITTWIGDCRCREKRRELYSVDCYNERCKLSQQYNVYNQQNGLEAACILPNDDHSKSANKHGYPLSMNQLQTNISVHISLNDEWLNKTTRNCVNNVTFYVLYFTYNPIYKSYREYLSVNKTFHNPSLIGRIAGDSDFFTMDMPCPLGISSGAMFHAYRSVYQFLVTISLITILNFIAS